MAKQSGLGSNLYVAGYNVSGDIGSVKEISSPLATLDSTGIDKYAMERLPGLRDGNLGYTSFFNDAALASHVAHKALPRTDVGVYYAHTTVLGAPAFAMTAKQIDYAGTRADDGSFTFDIQAQANSFGADWGKQLTAGVRTDTTATNGTGVDFGTGSTAFGLQAYVQVFAFTGTSVTIKIQESSDNAGDAYVDVTGGGFTVVSAAPTFERIQTTRALTVERYLRVVTTGTFSNVQFAVMVNRNPVTVSY